MTPTIDLSMAQKALFEQANNVFGSEASANSWINTFNKALGDAPKALLESHSGIAEVYQVLNAIAYGGPV